MRITKSSSGKRCVLLCVCGGIAAYKAVEVLRLLQREDCEVRVAATQESLRFVGTATWEGLTHERTAYELFDWTDSAIPHIDLAGWADVVLVMPATANVMAKMATGIADDLVSSTLLAVPAQTPLIVAPAMNVHMWQAPATQANVSLLREREVQFVMPTSGHLACDDTGEGKLAPIEQIADAVLSTSTHHATDKLSARHIVVTAGPTHEAIDPVRYIANSSSGKMGYAIARAAALRGADVTLISGPVSLPTPRGVRRIDVVSAAQMHDATLAAFADADVAICAAAVADYTPMRVADHKLKKSKERLDVIELTETADILAELCAKKREGGRRRMVVGFAAETNDLIENARAKLERKECDLIVANDVSREDSGFGADTNRVSFISAAGEEELPTLTKHEVAERLLDNISEYLDA